MEDLDKSKTGRVQLADLAAYFAEWGVRRLRRVSERLLERDESRKEKARVEEMANVRVRTKRNCFCGVRFKQDLYS